MKTYSKIPMIVVYIYPIVPLGLLATWMLFSAFSNAISHPETILGKNTIPATLFVIWFLGGVVGLYSGAVTLLGRYSRSNFWLLVYATASYTIIALAYIFSFIMNALPKIMIQRGGDISDLFNFLHGIYIVFTLFVIGRYLVKVYSSTKQI